MEQSLHEFRIDRQSRFECAQGVFVMRQAFKSEPFLIECIREPRVDRKGAVKCRYCLPVPAQTRQCNSFIEPRIRESAIDGDRTVIG